MIRSGETTNDVAMKGLILSRARSSLLLVLVLRHLPIPKAQVAKDRGVWVIFHHCGFEVQKRKRSAGLSRAREWER